MENLKRILDLMPKKEKCLRGNGCNNCYNCHRNNIVSEITAILSKENVCICPSEKDLSDCIRNNVNNFWYLEGKEINEYRFPMEHLPVLVDKLRALMLSGEK